MTKADIYQFIQLIAKQKLGVLGTFRICEESVVSSDAELPGNQRPFQREAIGEMSSLVVCPSGALLLFSGALTDLVAEIRNLIGDVGASFLAGGRCDQQADSHADPHAD